MSPPPRESLPANVIDFLVKPFTPEQLLCAVRSAFGAPVPEAPARRLHEKFRPPAPRAPEVVADHHEVALALSAAAVVRRETGRFSGARRSAGSVGPAPAAGTHEFAAGPRPADAARLRNALTAAANRQETGVLRVCKGTGAATEVYLDGGKIVVVATRDARGYGDAAPDVVPPKVNAATLEDAVAEQARTGTPFFLALGSSGLLSKSSAVSLLHRFGQRHFARLWSGPAEALTFEYEALDALPGFALRLEPRHEPVDQWLLDAVRHLQPADLMVVARHEGAGGVPRPLHGQADATARLKWNGQEREFLRHIDGRRSLATVASNVGVTPEEAYLILYRLRCLAVADYRPVGSAYVVTPRTSVRRVLPLQR